MPAGDYPGSYRAVEGKDHQFVDGFTIRKVVLPYADDQIVVKGVLGKSFF